MRVLFFFRRTTVFLSTFSFVHFSLSLLSCTQALCLANIKEAHHTPMVSIFKQPENIQTSPIPRSPCHCLFQKQRCMGAKDWWDPWTERIWGCYNAFSLNKPHERRPWRCDQGPGDILFEKRKGLIFNSLPHTGGSPKCHSMPRVIIRIRLPSKKSLLTAMSRGNVLPLFSRALSLC